MRFTYVNRRYAVVTTFAWSKHTFKSLEAFPASSKTSAVKYSNKESEKGSVGS